MKKYAQLYKQAQTSTGNANTVTAGGNVFKGWRIPNLKQAITVRQKPLPDLFDSKDDTHMWWARNWFDPGKRMQINYRPRISGWNPGSNLQPSLLFTNLTRDDYQKAQKLALNMSDELYNTLQSRAQAARARFSKDPNQAKRLLMQGKRLAYIPPRVTKDSTGKLVQTTYPVRQEPAYPSSILFSMVPTRSYSATHLKNTRRNLFPSLVTQPRAFGQQVFGHPATNVYADIIRSLNQGKKADQMNTKLQGVQGQLSIGHPTYQNSLPQLGAVDHNLKYSLSQLVQRPVTSLQDAMDILHQIEVNPNKYSKYTTAYIQQQIKSLMQRFKQSIPRLNWKPGMPIEQKLKQKELYDLRMRIRDKAWQQARTRDNRKHIGRVA